MGSPCCCCGSPRTIWKVDPSGNEVWSANHYADWGSAFTDSQNLVTYSGIGSGYPLTSDQDDEGNSYQIGGPSVPVDPVKSNTQPTIDSLRKYDPDGNLLWGWSHQPNGDTSGATRLAPIRLLNLKVTSGGISIVHHNPTQFFTSSANVIYGIDPDGETLWTITLATDTIWQLLEAGTDYFLLRDNGNYKWPGAPAYNGGYMVYVYEAATGTLVDILGTGDVTGSNLPAHDLPTSLWATIDRDDKITVCFSDDYNERLQGSAQIYQMTVDGSTGASPCSRLGVCQSAGYGYTRYIRRVTSMLTDGVHVVINGFRQHNSAWASNQSYEDDTWFTEFFDQYDGATPSLSALGISRILFLLRSTGTAVTRHSVQGPTAFNGDRIAYSGIADAASIWTVSLPDSSFDGDISAVEKMLDTTVSYMNEDSGAAETAIIGWTDDQHVACRRIGSDGSSTWHATQPLCASSPQLIQISPNTCDGEYTYTAVRVRGGFVWSTAPAGKCPDGCYLPTPAVNPTGSSDTFTVSCITGVQCSSQQHFQSAVDTGGSIPVGYTGTGMRRWLILASPCVSPCQHFGSPSARPFGASDGTIGANNADLYVGCK